jgi:hypothetical protein
MCNRDFKDCGEKEERCRQPLFDTVSLNLIAHSKTLLGRPSSRPKHHLVDLWICSSNLLLIDVITLVLALKR